MCSGFANCNDQADIIGSTGVVMIVVANLKNKYSMKTAFQLIAQHLQNSAYCYVDTLLLGHTAVRAYHHNCRLHHSLQRHKAASQLASQLHHSLQKYCRCSLSIPLQSAKGR